MNVFCLIIITFTTMAINEKLFWLQFQLSIYSVLCKSAIKKQIEKKTLWESSIKLTFEGFMKNVRRLNKKWTNCFCHFRRPRLKTRIFVISICLKSDLPLNFKCRIEDFCFISKNFWTIFFKTHLHFFLTSLDFFHLVLEMKNKRDWAIMKKGEMK